MRDSEQELAPSTDEAMEYLAAHARYVRITTRQVISARNLGRSSRSYAIIGSIADRGTSTCSAPYESGSIAPWSKKNRIPSLSTAKFW